MGGLDRSARPSHTARVQDLSEIAADEQAARTTFDLPDTVDRVRVRIPWQEFAGCRVEGEQLLAPDGVRVVATVREPILRKVGVRAPVEQFTRFIEDELTVCTEVELVLGCFDRLDIAIGNSLPEQGAIVRVRKDRVATET